MKKEYDLLVFMGRFQPFHLGHQAVIDEALKKAEQVLVIIGSSDGPRSLRNPFTYEEREAMITEVYGERHPKISFGSVPDYPYNDTKWIAAVRKEITKTAEICQQISGKPVKSIGLIGHSKDKSSYYLKSFPELKSVEVEDYKGINATDIREDLFSHSRFFMLADSMNDNVNHLVQNQMRAGKWWLELRKEYDLIKEYKDSWQAAPYPPTFVTTDAVVIQSGFILLVKRGHAPGIGQWALPGGFLNQGELLLDGCIRELREETRLKVPAPVLKGSVKGQHTFDDPNRSSRGRTLTTAFHFELTPMEDLPKVKGSDDAVDAKWVPLNELRRDNMFEDHWGIIDYFVGL